MRGSPNSRTHIGSGTAEVPARPRPADSVGGAITQIHAWNPRKEQVCRPEHIRAAWSQLEHQGWMRERKS